ncbi:MAG: hypothetical protein JSW51_09260 [Gemmatimonadota bacterium]|nr:MAG: hypothetical protein JSW51_09260 [Gemmatimonadota bacterium]
MTNPVSINRFLGLRNRVDTLRTVKDGAMGLTQADNIYLDDEQKIQFAEGFTRNSTTVARELICSKDEQRAMMIVGAQLERLNDDMTLTTIAADLDETAEYDYCEVNEDIYLISDTGDARVVGTDFSVRQWGLPIPDQVDLRQTSGYLPAGRYQVTCTFVSTTDGRESGAPLSTVLEVDADSGLIISDIPTIAGTKTRVYISSTNGDTLYRAFETTQTTVVWNGPVDELVDPLRTQFLRPPPAADRVTYYAGQLILSYWDAHRNISVLYGSQPLGFELFDTLKHVNVLPGRVHVLHGMKDYLLIGTDSEIYILTAEGLEKVADYGVPKGKSDVEYGKQVYFWSNRGVCRAAPFENLTEGDVSLPPGTDVFGAMMESGGVKKYVALLNDTGTARDAY